MQATTLPIWSPHWAESGRGSKGSLKWWDSLILQAVRAASRAWDLSCLSVLLHGIHGSNYLWRFLCIGLLSTFLLSHQPANTSHWGICLYLDALLLWQTRSKVSSPGHWIDLFNVQVPHLVFSDNFLSAVWERGPVAPTLYLIFVPSTSWDFLSLLCKIMKSLCPIARFSYNLGTKCILINIFPRTNQEA